MRFNNSRAGGSEQEGSLMTQMPVSCSDEKRSEFVWFASVFGFTTFALSSSYFLFQDVIAADCSMNYSARTGRSRSFCR